jgi:hypothetical protein
MKRPDTRPVQRPVQRVLAQTLSELERELSGGENYMRVEIGKLHAGSVHFLDRRLRHAGTGLRRFLPTRNPIRRFLTNLYYYLFNRISSFKGFIENLWLRILFG